MFCFCLQNNKCDCMLSKNNGVRVLNEVVFEGPGFLPENFLELTVDQGMSWERLADSAEDPVRWLQRLRSGAESGLDWAVVDLRGAGDGKREQLMAMPASEAGPRIAWLVEDAATEVRREIPLERLGRARRPTMPPWLESVAEVSGRLAEQVAQLAAPFGMQGPIGPLGEALSILAVRAAGQLLARMNAAPQTTAATEVMTLLETVRSRRILPIGNPLPGAADDHPAVTRLFDWCGRHAPERAFDALTVREACLRDIRIGVQNREDVQLLNDCRIYAQPLAARGRFL
jgi:hypothetical protein